MPEDTNLAAERCRIAVRVGCPAQGYVSRLGRTVGGHVHAQHFCFYVRGPQAVPVERVTELRHHECGGCQGDHTAERGQNVAESSHRGQRPVEANAGHVVDSERPTRNQTDG